VTGFLENLCKRTQTPLYCDTADRFNSYTKEPPTITPTTRRIRTGGAAKMGFTLDKVSRVGMTVARGSRTVFATSATVGHGRRFFSWSRPAAPGLYRFTVRATDLAGNRSDPETVTLRITKR